LAVRSRSETELVIETPHRRVGGIERPLVTLRAGVAYVLIEDGRQRGGEPIRVPTERLETVRLVPSAGAGLHFWRRSKDRWTVALRFKNGDDLVVEQGLEAAAALDLARAVSRLSGAELDEASQRMFGLTARSSDEE
jgi:hypothetical protein